MMKDKPVSSPSPAWSNSKKDRMILLLKVIHRMNHEYRSADMSPLVPPLQMISVTQAQQLHIRAGDVKPGEAPRVYESKSGFIVDHAHGVTRHDLDGSVTHLHPDGRIETTRPGFLRIEIHDLRDIVDHRIHRTLDTTSHAIHFANGGFFSFLTDENGTVIETVENGVVTSYDAKRGVLRLHGSCRLDDIEGGH